MHNARCKNYIEFNVCWLTHPPTRCPAPTAAARPPGAPPCSPRPADCLSTPAAAKCQHTTTRVNTPHLDILAGPGDHLREELGVVGVEGVVGGLAAGQGRGLRGLLQDAHAVAEVVRLLQSKYDISITSLT